MEVLFSTSKPHATRPVASSNQSTSMRSMVEATSASTPSSGRPHRQWNENLSPPNDFLDRSRRQAHRIRPADPLRGFKTALAEGPSNPEGLEDVRMNTSDALG